MTSDMQEDTEHQEFYLLDIARGVVAAFVSNNSLPVAELPALVRSIYEALNGLATGAAHVEARPSTEQVEKPTAAQIRKSVTPDGIISFVDGKTYKTMKRHLTKNGSEPRSYCQRFGLPADYPMVAPNYAAQRSALAKSIGLGRPGGRKEPAKPANTSGRKQGT